MHGSGEKHMYVENFSRQIVTERDEIVWRSNRRRENGNELKYILKELDVNIGTALCASEWGLVFDFNEHLTLLVPQRSGNFLMRD
jgi:hypothetical protein